MKAGEYVYTKIGDLKVCTSANFYGRVVQLKPPRPTRGEDLIMSLVVTDETVPYQSGLAAEEPDGIVVNIFKSRATDFPAIQLTGLHHGDIVELRHFRIQSYQGSLQAVSAKWSAWTVFGRDEEMGRWEARPAREIAQTELDALTALEQGISDAINRAGSLEPNDLQQEQQPGGECKQRRTRQTLTIAQLEPNIFFDLVAEVTSVIAGSSPFDQQYSFLVNDYTTEGSLLVTVWDNFVREAAALVPGDLVYIKNLHARQLTSTDSESANGIAATLHGDPTASKRVAKLEPGSALLQQFLQRKSRHAESLTAQEQSEQLPVELLVTGSKVSTSLLWKNCVGVTKISAVLACPRKNNKFCIRGHVIGHVPERIEDFSKHGCLACQRIVTTIDQNGSRCPYCRTCDSMGFLYAFSLTVSDGTGRINLILALEDAVLFFGAGQLPATDFSKDPAAKNKLEKMMVALGEAEGDLLFGICSYEVDGKRRYRVQATVLNIS